MIDLVEMTKVYIVESPSFIDILDKRNEGIALSEMLNLARIKNELYKVSDIETFQIALERIAKDLNGIKSTLGGVYIHFSMHGSKDGIALSDNTFLDWKTFYIFLKAFNDSIGYITLPIGIKIAPTTLIFSVCDGFSASIIKEIGEESPYTGLIGPTQPVGWSDSLLAFSIFYHNVILKKKKVTSALINMNECAGLDNVFRVDVGKGMMSI